MTLRWYIVSLNVSLCCIDQGLGMFPFFFLLHPQINKLLTHSTPTGYTRRGSWQWGMCWCRAGFWSSWHPSILPVLRTRHIETSQANPETQTSVLGPDVWAMHDVWWVNSPGIFHPICEKTRVSFLHVLVVPGGLGLNWHQFHLLSKFEKLQNFRTSCWREFSTDLFPIGLYLGTGESQWSVASTARAQWIVTGFVHASSHLALFKHWEHFERERFCPVLALDSMHINESVLNWTCAPPHPLTLLLTMQGSGERCWAFGRQAEGKNIAYCTLRFYTCYLKQLTKAIDSADPVEEQRSIWIGDRFG